MYRCLLFIIASSSLMAGEIRVSPSGDKSSKVISEAIKRAESGDTIILGPGIYFEQVTLDKPLTLKGEDGAIIDGSESLRADWQAAGEDMHGVFYTEVAKEPFGLLLDGKFIASLRYDRAKKDGDWNWKKLLSRGPPLSGFSNIKALWMYHPEEKRIYVHLPEGVDLNRAKLSFTKKESASLHLENVSDVKVEGLTFQGGYSAIEIEGNSSNNVVRNCKIVSYEETGILITGGASNNLIEKNEITRGALEDWTPSLAHDRANYEIWRIHKDVGYYDRIGINIFRAGAGNKILENHIYLVFDGVCIGDYSAESLSKPLPDKDHGRDTEIAGNVIENTRDSGIELGVGCINVNVHHNTFNRTHGGFRFKVPRIGPVYIHHNQFIDGSPFNVWYSMDNSPAEGYIYNNTFIGAKPALTVNLKEKQSLDIAAPRWHFINNLIQTKEGLYDKNQDHKTELFTASNNIELKSTGDDMEVPSQAIDAGLDLSTYRDGKPLPGFEKKSYQGKGYDIGAIETSASN